ISAAFKAIAGSWAASSPSCRRWIIRVGNTPASPSGRANPRPPLAPSAAPSTAAAAARLPSASWAMARAEISGTPFASRVPRVRVRRAARTSRTTVPAIGSERSRRSVLRRKADRLLLSLPIAGTVVREVLAARLTRTLGTLLANRVPLISALAIAQDALGNLAAAAAVEGAALGAKGGRGLARPLGEAGVFPTRMIHLLQLGEEAAQLPAMALKAADIHDEQARLMIQRIVALAI